MSASLLTVWRAARARAVPFAGESAGYVILLACEELLHSPRNVGLTSVVLEGDGAIRVLGAEPAEETLAESQLRSVLARLLEVASSPGPGLFRVASRPSCGSLKALAAELEKALIPVNRAAARRALTRLHRETERAREKGQLATDEVSVPLASMGGQNDLSVEQPQLEHPTRPETLAARLRGAVQVPNAPLSSAKEVLTGPVAEEEDATDQFTFALDPSAHEQPLPGVEPKAEATPTAPPLERRTVHSDVEAWPTELANEADALPLEAEWCAPMLRKGRPPKPTPVKPALSRPVQDEPELEILLESPLGLSSLPIAVRARAPIADDSDLEATPELRREAYPGMPPQRSDVRQLVTGFEVAQALGENDLREHLKRWAGVDGTPAPKTRFGKP